MGNSQLTSKRTCLKFIISKIFKTKFLKLVGAIKMGNLSLVKYYYANKVNFNQYLHNGDTPLHVAVRYNQLEIVKFIAENVYYLNFNDKNFIGDTPLMIAIMNGNLKMVEYLVLKKNADVNIPESRGFTPFMAACANGNINLVKFLVRNECNIRAKSKDGQTALHRAAFYGNIEVVKYLIKELKMNVLLPDRKGNLPLHFACMKLSISCIRILCKATNYRSTVELLHIQNRYGVKPIDLLVKLLNRMRHFDELQEYDMEQIEEYIRDKRNIPHFKRVFSPTSFQKIVLFDKNSLFKTTRKATTSHGELQPTQSDSSIIRPKATIPNETSSANMKVTDFLDGTSPTEERLNKDTEEEDHNRFRNLLSDTAIDEHPISPLLNLKSHLSADPSPASFDRKAFKSLTTSNPKEGRPILRVSTKLRASSVLKSGLNEKNKTLVLDDPKSGSVSFTTPIKSRFAIQNSPTKLPEEP